MISFTVLEEIFPRHLTPLIACKTAEHAAERRLDPGSKLVVWTPGSDAFNERTIFVTVSKGKVVGETSIRRELARGRRNMDGGVLPGPRLRTNDLDRP